MKTYFEWDPIDDVIVAERDEAGNVIAEYTHEGGYHGRLISQRRNGQSYFYHYDGDGNTLALTDENGNVTDTYAYNAFGEMTEHTGTTVNPFRYQGALGYYFDEFINGYHVRARDYDQRSGRWLSSNPIPFADGVNNYIYAMN
jgi:RHS repeat-associated protein